MRSTFSIATAALAVVSAAGLAHAQDKVPVGQLVDFTGPTSFVGKHYGPGVTDAIKWINANGGVSGTKIDLDTVDYGYKVPEAISHYKRWKSRGIVAMQGWGTADTEALISFVARDKIPVWSASYSAHLTDPKGKNPKTKKPAPYNFFYGPSYSDACRALVQWAAQDAKQRGIAKPVFLHTGDNHPYPNAPKKACAAYATELGFTVAPPVVVPLKPGDFKAQCLTIKQTGAHYIFMGNLGGSVVSLLNSCKTVGVEAVYMGNPWAGDYLTVEAAQSEIIFPSSSAFFGQDVPGMKLVRDIIANGDGMGKLTVTHHYIRGICSAFYMKEAMDWAKANGGLSGENVRNGMYARKDWVPKGLEGVCLPSTWTSDDHRGLMRVAINRGSIVNGKAKIERVTETTLPRRADWLGQ